MCWIYLEIEEDRSDNEYELSDDDNNSKVYSLEEQSNISSKNDSQLNDGQVSIPNKPNITIKIEEDGNDVSESRQVNSSTSSIDQNYEDTNFMNQIVTSLEIQDTNDQINPFQEDFEYLTDSPKQEHTLIKSRLLSLDNPEIKIEGNCSNPLIPLYRRQRWKKRRLLPWQILKQRQQ